MELILGFIHFPVNSLPVTCQQHISNSNSFNNSCAHLMLHVHRVNGELSMADVDLVIFEPPKKAQTHIKYLLHTCFCS